MKRMAKERDSYILSDNGVGVYFEMASLLNAIMDSAGERAKVPMLPIVFGDRVAAVCVAATSAMLTVFSVLIFLFTPVSVFYVVTALALGGLVLGYGAKLAFDRTRSTAWTLFKITSPYLMLLFLVLGVTIWV
jgi:protoheme IX farnesyltransferase